MVRPARPLARVLAEVADGGAAIDGDLTAVGRLLAGDEAENGRLAGAVGADQTDPVVVEAIDKVLASAKRHSLRAGIFCKSVGYAADMAKKGFDLVTVESDEGLLMQGTERLAKFRELL